MTMYSVSLCVCLQNDHEHLAVKVFKKKGLRPKEAKLLLQEVAILR